MKFRSLLVTGSLGVGLAVGCTLAVDFEDREPDAGAKKDAATTKPDASSIPEDTGTIEPEDSAAPFDPLCVRAAPFTGLPRTLDDAAVDAGFNVVCCAGKLTDLTKPEHCGGCGIDCNTGGNAYACETFVGSAGAHSYCTGCKTKFPADQTAASASCQTTLCSGSPPFATAGRCAPSNGVNDCVDSVCANAYGGAVCARYADAAPMRDPSFFCIYQ